MDAGIVVLLVSAAVVEDEICKAKKKEDVAATVDVVASPTNIIAVVLEVSRT